MSNKPMKDPSLPPGEEVAFVINGVTHYTNGRFEHSPELVHGDMPKLSGLYDYGYSNWITNYVWGPSQELNKLKAKIYNILEASPLDDRQVNAMKSLIKGFATDTFHAINEETRRFIEQMGFRDVLERSGTPAGSDPLVDLPTN